MKLNAKNLTRNTLASTAFWQINKSLVRQITLALMNKTIEIEVVYEKEKKKRQQNLPSIAINCALLMSDLLGKEAYHEQQNKLRTLWIKQDKQNKCRTTPRSPEDGYFYCSQKWIEADTTIPPKGQVICCHILENLGLIKTAFAGNPARKYYKIFHDQWLKYLSQKVDLFPGLKMELEETDEPEIQEPGSPNWRNLSRQSGATLDLNNKTQEKKSETRSPLPSFSGHQQSQTLLQGEQKKRKSEKQETHQQTQQSASAVTPQRNADEEMSVRARQNGKQSFNPDVERSQKRIGDQRKATGLKKSSTPQSPPSPLRYPTKDAAAKCLNSTAAGTMIGQVLQSVSETEEQKMTLNELTYCLFQKQVSVDDLWAAMYHGLYCWKAKKPLERLSSWLMSDKPWRGEKHEFCQSNDSDKNWKEFQELPAAIRWYYSLPVEQREQVAPSAQTDDPEWWVSPGFVGQMMHTKFQMESRNTAGA